MINDFKNDKMFDEFDPNSHLIPDKQVGNLKTEELKEVMRKQL